MLNQHLFELFEKTVLTIRERKDYLWMPHEVENLLSADFHAVQQELDAHEEERERRVAALEGVISSLAAEQTAVGQLQAAITLRAEAEKALVDAQRELESLRATVKAAAERKWYRTLM